MTADQYKHTWTLPADSRMLRMYGWMWKAEPEGTTFCKLFWGYVFAPLNLLARLVWTLLWPLRAALRPVGRSFKEAEARAAMKPEKPEEPKEEIPGRIADFFARHGVRRACKIIGLCLLVPASLAVLALVVVGLVVLVRIVPAGIAGFVDWFLHTDAWVIVSIVAFYVVVMVALRLIDKRWDVDARSKRRRARKKAEREAKGKLTFWQLLYHGVIAVKANTCPRIEVKD